MMKHIELETMIAESRKHIEYIRSKSDNRALLEQLAEEYAEAAQATLKLIRAWGYSSSPTDIKPAEAFERMLEEHTDILNVLNVIGIDLDRFTKHGVGKLERWAKRLGYKEGTADEE